MLKITHEQMAALEQPAWERTEAFAREDVLRRAALRPGLGGRLNELGHTKAEAVIADAVALARKHGFRMQGAVVNLAEAMLMHGDRLPLAILNEPIADEDLRVHIMCEIAIRAVD